MKLKITSVFVLFCLILMPGVRGQEATPLLDPIFVLDARSLYGYSKVAGDSEGDFSTDQAWLTSLGWTLSETDKVFLAYNGSFTRDNLFISQEEGSRSSNKLMANNFTGGWDHQVSDSVLMKSSFFYHVIWIEETEDESLGRGLYDYDDLGGQILFEKFIEHEFPKKASFGYSYFKRKYPHFSSLLAAFDPNSAIEVKEKDLFGHKVDFGYQGMIAERWNGQIAGYVLVKDYTDKKTIDENGIRQPHGRDDLYLELNGLLTYDLTDQITVGYTSSVRQNFSNLDFYDTRNSATLADDRFFESYYDFLQYTVNPSVTFRSHAQETSLDGSEPETPNGYHEVRVGYKMDATYYHGRTAQDAAGDLIHEEQRDWIHTIYADFSMPLPNILDGLSFLISGRYTGQDSNQKFEDFYIYNYETWSVMTGFSFSN